jgi:hypothetical protein
MCRNEGETTHCTWSAIVFCCRYHVFAWRACPVTSPADTCSVLHPSVILASFFSLFQVKPLMDSAYSQVMSSDSQGIVFLQAVSR